MSKLKLSPDLFLESQEIERLRRSLDDEGFRRNIIENTVKFGFIKNSSSSAFTNGRIEADADLLGVKTVKMRSVYGIDTNGQYFTSKPINSISIPSNNNWYWLKVNHVYSNLEQGVFTLAPNGDLVDTSGTAKLTKIFRGMPNFPTRIKFVDSTYNQLFYDVLEVIDDTHAIIQHPATNGSGIAAFEGETDLKIKIVGTFTPGVAVPNTSMYCFDYDSASINILPELVANVSPVFTVSNTDIYGGQTISNGFDLARVKSDGTNLVIQDKRNQFWETKGSNIPLEIDRAVNKLIGIEAVKFNDLFTPGDRNIVEVVWGMRSDNWSIDSAKNIVTFNSGLGGKFKTVNDFTNGDLDGYRLYAVNGKYHRVISSVKQGSAINFTLDTLEMDNFSVDGGINFIAGTLNVVPDTDTVEIKFVPNTVDDRAYIAETFTFPVNTLIGRCDVLVYADSTVLYNVSYRYKAFKEFTEWKAIPSDTVAGYYTEASYLPNGQLKPSLQIVKYPYTSSAIGFIQLKLSPFSIYRFKNKVDKGDLIGVNQISTFVGITTKTLTVGIDKNYQFITGNVVLPNDIYFDLNKIGSVEGNEFRIHFNCTTLDLAGSSIFITQGLGTSGQSLLKQIKKADVYAMFNQDGGIVFTFKYKVIGGVGEWIMYKNYDLGISEEVRMVDGVITNLFDATTGMGTVKGLFGYCVCNTARTVDGIIIPDLTQRFLIGANPGVAGFDEGDAAGSATHTNTLAEMVEHDHYIIKAANARGLNIGLGADDVIAMQNPPEGGNSEYRLDPAAIGAVADRGKTSKAGSANPAPYSILNPYYAIIIAKKTY